MCKIIIRKLCIFENVILLGAVTDDLRQLVKKLEGRVVHLEKDGGKKSAAAPVSKKDDDDEDVDLFGSDEDEEEDAEKVRIREQRLKDYYEKKSKKPALIAKTSVLLDVKPWDDETDMDAMLKKVLSIHKEGLVWGACKRRSLQHRCEMLACVLPFQPNWCQWATASTSCR